MSNFAYIRVSSKDQNEDRQILAITELNIPQKNIYIDRQSGKTFNRPAYQSMLHRMKKVSVKRHKKPGPPEAGPYTNIVFSL